ncbi:fungal hydrophobin-domain-containing protein [Gymnopilus junonius]|uniref:Hydrophobin n=1 Tax=Gymnopilus junonius TaxID=109634 RepID=A0A9P5P023_GYMJU|nr:fungal hydrophobin-domain-containing protein [Gymnopilus junonius]
MIIKYSFIVGKRLSATKQFKLSTLQVATVALASLAVATPARRNEPASQCNAGCIQCCQSIEQADDPATASVIKSLGIVVQDVTTIVDLTCDPITIIGAGSSSCSAQPVCCENNSFKGLIAIDCTPVDITLQVVSPIVCWE